MAGTLVQVRVCVLVGVVLAAVLVRGAWAGTCVAAGTRATVTTPAGTGCLLAYTSTWTYLGLVPVSNAAAPTTATTPTYRAPVGHVEFYGDALCAPAAFVESISCTPGPVPTRPATTPTPTPMPTATRPPVPPAPTTPAVPASTTVPAVRGYNGGPPAGQVRAMWVWGKGGCLFNRLAATAGGTYAARCEGAKNAAAYQDALLARLTNPFGRYAPFNRLYVDMDPTLLADASAAPAVRAFLAKAAARGVTVELLAGDSTWVTTAALMAVPVNICRQVAAFNRASVVPAQRFVGVHLDIEPYTLPDWPRNAGAGADPFNDAYQANLISIFRQCQTAVAGAGLLVAWDIPAWFSALATDLFVPLRASPFVDYVGIMNYYGRSRADPHARTQMHAVARTNAVAHRGV
jgi:hypothetical protein